jgi:hypothetical protein
MMKNDLSKAMSKEDAGRNLKDGRYQFDKNMAEIFITQVLAEDKV